MSKIIHQFIKNKKGNLVGCIAAYSKDNIGWSLCNKKDKFDKAMALKIALGRADVNPIDNETRKYIPHILQPYADYFINDRCVRYYKS